MKDWKQQSVLLAGLGSIGQRHLRALLALGVTDIRACDPSEASAEKARAIYPALKIEADFEAGLAARPDAVYILTPPKMHIPMALRALEAGCDVFSEKPLSDTLDGVEELQARLKETGRQMGIGLCFRYHQGIRKAKTLLDSGAVGRLVSVRSLMGEHFPSVRPDYKTLYSAKYSGAFDLMHDLDLAMWFAGRPVRELHCVYGTYSDIDIESPDVVEILIGFEDRCTATVHLDFFQQPRRRQVELICTEGCILVDFSTWDTCTVRVYRAAAGAWEDDTFATDRDDMFRDESRAFLERIAGGAAAEVYGVDDALLSLRALHEVQRKDGK